MFSFFSGPTGSQEIIYPELATPESEEDFVKLTAKNLKN